MAIGGQRQVKKLSNKTFSLNIYFRKLAYDLWYPFDSQKSPNYELIFFLQTATECVMLMTYAICDGIFPCLCVIVIGQIQILGKITNKK